MWNNLINNNYFLEGKTVFLSIIIEAFPFLLIGALVGSIIEVFISEEKFRQILPKSWLLGTLYACLIGLIFPICECAIIPIAARLIRKGVPTHLAIIFMLATPIINPVAVGATYFAFFRTPEISLHRVIFGVGTAVVVGWLFARMKKKQFLRSDFLAFNNRNKDIHHHHDHHKDNFLSKIKSVLRHTRDEFFDVGGYLVLGALISTLVQFSLPQSFFDTVNKSEVVAMLSLQVFAYGLSLCSHADAFVGASIAHQFTRPALLAFLITSPLIDIKNTIILLRYVPRKIALTLIGSIFILAFVFSYLYKLLI